MHTNLDEGNTQQKLVISKDKFSHQYSNNRCRATKVCVNLLCPEM
jgi:hypothetical protein